MAVIGKDNIKKTHINPLKKTVAATKGADAMTKSLRDTIYNACSFNINFIWNYTLILMANDWGTINCIDIERIDRVIDKIIPNTSHMKSIVQIYQYMVQNKDEIFDGKYLTVDQLGVFLPQYKKYLDSTVTQETEEKIEEIKEKIVREKLNPNNNVISVNKDGKLE